MKCPAPQGRSAAAACWPLARKGWRQEKAQRTMPRIALCISLARCLSVSDRGVNLLKTRTFQTQVAVQAFSMTQPLSELAVGRSGLPRVATEKGGPSQPVGWYDETPLG